LIHKLCQHPWDGVAAVGPAFLCPFAWRGSNQEGQPEPISIGITVNLTKRNVTGLDEKPPLTEPPLEIQRVNETAITFGMYWSSKDGQTIKGASGKLDRLTGDMEVTRTFTQDAYLSTSAWNYSLKCRPTKRMF
jgi:hypothetical protein